jgi:hypothetical protein
MATTTGFQQDNFGAFIEKDPTAELTYTIDWSSWLPTSATISTSTFTVENPAGDAVPLASVTTSNTTTKANITLSGGTAGYVYKVYNTITTSSGSIDRRHFRIKIKERSL